MNKENILWMQQNHCKSQITFKTWKIKNKFNKVNNFNLKIEVF